MSDTGILAVRLTASKQQRRWHPTKQMFPIYKLEVIYRGASGSSPAPSPPPAKVGGPAAFELADREPAL